MTTIKEFAETWKEFKERQQKVRDRNWHSEEHDIAQKEVFNLDWRLVGTHLDFYWKKMEKALDKDCYKDTLEGMFDWISDGKPQWGKKL